MAKGTAVRALSAGVGLLLIFAGPAQAGMHGDVMKFPEKYPLKKAKRIAVDGSRVDGSRVSTLARVQRRPGCRLPAGSLSLNRGERAVELRQLSLNLRTCRAVFERGVPPRSVIEKSAPPKQKAASVKGKGTSGSSQRGQGVLGRGVSAASRWYPTMGSAGPAPGYRYGGYVKAFWEDPAGINVNTVWDGADWNVSPRNRRCIGRNHTWQRYQWYRRSWWRRPVNRSSWTNSICRYVMSGSYARFFNDGFCAGADTFATYDPVRFYGFPNGHETARYRTWVTGSVCRRALRFNLVIVRSRPTLPGPDPWGGWAGSYHEGP